MEIIIIGILAIALLLGLALFVFKNAAKIVALVLVLFIGYIGWHIYLKDKGITPKQATESVGKKGEGILNDVFGSVSSASTKALDTAKEKAIEVTDKAKETIKKKAKDKANEVLE
jgi:hypothetical protein